jgi:hypothetical protein
MYDKQEGKKMLVSSADCKVKTHGSKVVHLGHTHGKNDVRPICYDRRSTRAPYYNTTTQEVTCVKCLHLMELAGK